MSFARSISNYASSISHSVVNYVVSDVRSMVEDLKTCDVKNPNFCLAATRIKDIAQGVFVFGGGFLVPNHNFIEYELDYLIHFFNGAVGRKASPLFQGAALLMNQVRVYNIGYYLDRGTSTVVPYWLNYIDLGSHFTNSFVRLVSILAQDQDARKVHTR